jgi:Cytochrome c3
MLLARLFLFLFLVLPLAAAPRTANMATGCVSCHSQAETQPHSSMGQALETVEDCKILIDHPVLRARVREYMYRIERKGNQSNYSVTDGVQTITAPIRWAMGASSSLGQTYIVEKDGELYESRVSYYRELKALAPTLGSANLVPGSLNEAFGRLINSEEKLDCFGCHSTDATSGGQLTLDRLRPGVQCSHCHEGSESHLLAAIQSEDGAESVVPKSLAGGLAAERISDFCGQCHRTWEEIAMQPNLGIGSIRFQPYRLAGSKCYDADDPRISCLACHDPHRELDAQTTDYDSKCQACHGGRKAGAKRCRVGKSDCASCHMPKLELPGAHYKFSDHRIRIVKPDESYPE